jgi:uncharacterized lipoprotein
MNRDATKTLILSAALAALVAGCASDPRYAQGIKWVQENEAAKAELERQGFPQYTGPN